MDERISTIFGLVGGLALFLYGMNSMSDALQKAAGEKMKKILGFLTRNPLMGALAGALVTAVLQSSSATTVMVIGFVSAGLMSLPQAISVIFGANIGTTITAILASIGQSKNAKRTAVAHCTFNITGTVLFMFLIKPLASFVQWISPKGGELDIISRQIANAHTTFNIVCTVIWLPLIPLMVKIVQFIIRGKDGGNSEKFVARYLDEKAMSHPAAAIYMASKEISRMANHAGQMLSAAKTAISKRYLGDSRSVYADEYRKVKELWAVIIDFITGLISSGNLTENQAEQAAGLMVVTNSIDRIADRCQEIDTTFLKIQNDGGKLSDSAIGDLTECMEVSQRFFNEAVNAIENGGDESLERIATGKKKMRKLQRQAGKAHLARIKKKSCSGSLTADYSAILYSIDRMADNSMSIAEEALENFTFDKLEIENMDADMTASQEVGAQA